jgi:hypothetical protein
MAEWLVELKGTKIDLGLLYNLSLQGWKIIEQEGKYYLQSADLDSSADGQNVHENASRTLDVMYGVAKLTDRKFECPKIGGIRRIEKNGRPPTQFIFPSSISSAERFGMVSITNESRGQEPSEPPSNPGLKWIEIAEKDLSAARALTLYGGLMHNLRNLYMVLEIVEKDIGGENRLIDTGWAKKNEIRLFKQTASTVPIADQARHAPGKYKIPAKPMSMDDAESLIKDILENWLRSKLTIIDNQGGY